MNSASSLAVQSLTCIRGRRVVFRDLSFAVGAGRLLVVEGPNGAGKTSLLRLIAGFLAPEAGRVELDGVTDAEERGKRIGWLGHHDAAKVQFTPAETLSFFQNLYGVTADIGAALAEVGLSRVADLSCQYLSAGQKKRLALARLKICGRPLWLMDEPLAALDAQGKALAASMITAHCGAGGIAVVATHEALGIAGETLMLGAA
ncbi:MAG TPA: heme ABC exporter ATP-binding protein CcmA [Rhizomicrobium sp.]|nr:heme ABC exporter ATP-binding protein CcmA [Rhizomicrobium sp.]